MPERISARTPRPPQSPSRAMACSLCYVPEARGCAGMPSTLVPLIVIQPSLKDRMTTVATLRQLDGLFLPLRTRRDFRGRAPRRTEFPALALGQRASHR